MNSPTRLFAHDVATWPEGLRKQALRGQAQHQRHMINMAEDRRLADGRCDCERLGREFVMTDAVIDQLAPGDYAFLDASLDELAQRMPEGSPERELLDALEGAAWVLVFKTVSLCMDLLPKLNQCPAGTPVADVLAALGTKIHN
jgi:ribosomal protein RSM22 (predicted rRNA methylase)